MAQRRGSLVSSIRDPARSSRLLLLAAVLVVLLVGLKVGASIAGRGSAADRVLVGATAPLAVGANQAVEGAGGLRGFFQGPALLGKNAQLAADNAQLQARISELEELEAENAALREQLKLKPSAGFQQVTATVIARPFDPWIETAVLSAGTERGIRAGCVVVSNGALAGKISESSVGFSRMELISSPRFRIAASANPGGYEGVVRGISSGELALDYIRAGAAVDIESKVFTRGSTGLPAGEGLDGSPPVPRGILIGQIVEKSSDSGFLRLHLRPAADINRLSIVTVYVP